MAARGATPFQTDYRYTDRQTKAEYVWRKYGILLRGRRILDVGADRGYLRRHLDRDATYWGIGLGGCPDQQVDLEQGPLPFAAGAFDCVLCLDVLEHLESIHTVFDELCRVARRHVIVSLPNPWRDFWQMLRKRDYRPGAPLKYYGLPAEPPEDRHRWFFSHAQARAFVRDRAEKCRMTIVQMDDDASAPVRWTTRAARWWQARCLRWDLDLQNLYAGTLWVVLEKEETPEMTV